MKQSFSWWCFVNRGIEPEALLKAARAMGYSAVELINPDLFTLAQDNGLAIASMEGPGNLNDAAQHDAIERENEAKLAIAVKYGIPNLILFSGSRREGQTDEEGAETVAIGVRRLVKAAQDAGVTLVMELLNSKVDHKGYQCDHTPWLAEIVKSVDSPRFKMLYDIYHMQIMEGDIIRTIGENAEHISHYHTAGVPGRHEIDDSQELYYPAIIRAIAETKYAGYVGHEFVPTGDVLGSLRHAFTLTDEASR
jgi:hydroxypyruvate isomerase